MSKNDLQIICIGSGSGGNCYLLGKGQEYVMVECGLPFKVIIGRMNDYGISIDQVKAVVVSHSHKDHSLALADFECLNIPTFCPYKESNTLGSGSPFKLTEWLKAVAFEVTHDVACYGFVFLTQDKESVLFVTDTRYIESKYFNFRFNYIMIECNHIRKQLEAIMDKALLEGNESKVFKFKRQASYHLSLAGVKKTLSKMDLTDTKAIFLLHLSKECCNDALIKQEIAEKFKKRTFVCYQEGRIN